MTSYRGRFAPSPTGDLHFGSLVAALGSWLDARAHGGEWLVRIEDLDPPREVAGAAERQLATLAAFGLEADAPVVRQSERAPLYDAALAGLEQAGRLFRCACSRSDLAASNGIHRACLRPWSPGLPYALRLRMPDETICFDDRCHGRTCQALATAVGDLVLRRSDGHYAYQLAVVVDDAAQGVTDVVRGADLLDSTPRQILLQRLLGLPTPRYLHLPLVRDEQGRKLSKSLAALPVDSSDPLPALRAAWRHLGQDERIGDAAYNVGDFLRLAQRTFEWRRIPHSVLNAGVLGV